jgi:hypothetical protein
MKAICTSSWKVKYGNVFISGINVVPGNDSQANAYRSELLGIYAVTVVVICLAKYTEASGGVTIGCNNDAALNQIECRQVSTVPSEQHSDLGIKFQANQNETM